MINPFSRSVPEKEAEQADLFSAPVLVDTKTDQKLYYADPKSLYHKGDPDSSIISANTIVKSGGQLNQQQKLIALLMLYNNRTSKELEKLSFGTDLELTHHQIDRRAGEIEGVLRDRTIIRDCSNL